MATELDSYLPWGECSPLAWVGSVRQVCQFGIGRKYNGYKLDTNDIFVCDGGVWRVDANRDKAEKAGQLVCV